MDLENMLKQLTELVVLYGPKLVGAIAVWIIGNWVINAIAKGFGKMLNKQEVDESLKPFLKGTVSTLLKVMLVISVLGMLGIEMTAFIAVLGAIGLAIGMALSGTLQNFAGGVIILLFKPFKVGDVITAQGYTGKVSEIQIFNTILKTPDNKTVIIPNGGLSTSSMVNFSTEEKRRVDWTFGIGYGDSTETAEAILRNLIEADTRIVSEPDAPFIAVSELADSSVNLVVRAWVNASDYWGVFFDMNRNVYNTFNKEGINIPFPQMDVHVHNN
ncbi:MAG: mechanosensitive ion channel [Bacteroidetes bacterium]|nr:MAG: mechanosensitive ion channel [Bacteroidota bacterium]